MLKLMLFVVMSLLQHHVLDLHKSDLSASLILIKLHAYILYALPGLRDNDMLKSIYAPSGLLYLRCASLSISGSISERDFTASSSSPDVNANPYEYMSFEFALFVL